MVLLEQPGSAALTVIAYRDGIMAADSGSFSGCCVFPYARKLARGPDGTLYGIAGRLSEASFFLAWVDGGCVGEAPKARIVDDVAGTSSFRVVRVRRGSGPEYVDAYGVQPFLDAPYLAEGAGEDFALGAFHAGASAIQAVEAAIAHCQHVAGPVRSIRHEG